MEIVEHFAYAYGALYDSYLATEPGRELFWSQDSSGVVAFVRMGRHLEISGGLLAPSESKPLLLAELVAYASQQRLSLSFYNVGDDDLPLLRSFGFEATKCGEEAVIDLGLCTWKGKAFEWVRRQSNYCRRNGIIVSECRRELLPDGEWDRRVEEMRGVSSALVADKPQTAEMKFVEGRFDPEQLGRRRIFLAQSAGAAGRIEAFLVCNPFANGRRWTFETYRRRPDAVRGSIPYLMHETAQLLAAEGAERVSLCLVPALRCSSPMPGDSPLARWGFVLSKYFDFVYDSAGLYHFKSRFRPVFEDRYMCVWPRVTLGSAWAFIRLVGVVELSPLKMARTCWHRLCKRATRATLSVPENRAA
jgi:phosphatidylglycerol lysyltransferase